MENQYKPWEQTGENEALNMSDTTLHEESMKLQKKYDELRSQIQRARERMKERIREVEGILPPTEHGQDLKREVVATINYCLRFLDEEVKE